MEVVRNPMEFEKVNRANLVEAKLPLGRIPRETKIMIELNFIILMIQSHLRAKMSLHVCFIKIDLLSNEHHHDHIIASVPSFQGMFQR